MIYTVLFWLYILAVAVMIIYDLVNIRNMKISRFIIEMTLIWMSAAANMFVLYQLGISGIKFFLVPDIMALYFFAGLGLQGYGVYKVIKKIS